MMGDVVFVDLNHRPPGFLLVSDLGLAADTNNGGIVGRRCNQSIQSIGCHRLKRLSVKEQCRGPQTTNRISVHGEDILVESGVDSDDVSHLMVYLQLQRRHRGVEVNSVEVVHQEDLTVTFATISGSRAFSRFADFDNDHVSADVIQD